MDINYNTLFNLKNKVAIVTGGGGHLGSEMTKGLSDMGATVFVFGRNPDKYSDLSLYNNKINIIQCDVSDEKQFSNEVEKIQDKLFGIDILVNNAFNEDRKPIEEMTRMDWDMGIDNILSQVFFCTQAVLPGMLKKGNGSIINIASIYGFLGINQSLYQEVKSSSVFYSTAKGGIIQMTRCLATEYASKGIRVNCISPGHFPKKTKGVPERPGYIVGLSDKTPMKRIGQPYEIPGGVIYLASDASSFVTGQNIIIDGGWSAW